MGRPRQGANRRCLGLLCIAAFAARASAAEPGDAGETAFVDKYHCAVVATLNAIQDTPMATSEDQNRFLIVSYVGRQENYAECAYYDRDRALHC